MSRLRTLGRPDTNPQTIQRRRDRLGALEWEWAWTLLADILVEDEVHRDARRQRPLPTLVQERRHEPRPLAARRLLAILPRRRTE